MEKFNFSTGDRVRITAKQSVYEGIVMPRPELADKEHIVLKLDNGYNIGILISSIIKIEKLGAQGLRGSMAQESELKYDSEKPKISVIATGGTITSKVDYRTGGVFPYTTAEELLESVPELAKIVNVKHILKPFTLWSEDMTPNEWGEIAKEVAKELNDSEVRGVIVTHGTDTLHYTAAALSFMLKNLNKPVALVGAQRSVDRGSFDGNMNLICAAHYCLSDIAEVAIVMHGKTDDEFSIASRGTKVRKMHSSRRDTFRPINEFPLAKIFPDGSIVITNPKHRTCSDSKVEADTKFEEKTALIYYYPGASPEILDYYVSKDYKGIIIAGTGFGHVSTNPLKEENKWLPSIKKAVEKGVFVGITTQTLYGETDPLVYSAGRLIQEAGAVYLKDMLPEVAYVKLGWVLGQTKALSKIKELMLTNVANEFTERIEPETFLY